MKKSLLVSEIFKSIQGESSHQGLPCVFIRLSGCNLSCSFCDSVYARSGGEMLRIDEIVEKALKLCSPLVEVTGGEPLFQENVYSLFAELQSRGLKVMLETNGSLDIRAVPEYVLKIMDIKCPSSGMDSHMRFENIASLQPQDEVKFVISDRSDYDWAKVRLDEYRIQSRCQVLFSPVFGILSPAEMARWMMEDNLQVRLNLQIHKYIWGRDTRK